MKASSLHLLVPLCCLCLLPHVAADDAPPREATVKPRAMPAAIDLVPAEIDVLFGFNRLDEAYARLWRLSHAMRPRTDSPDIREWFFFKDIVPGVLDFGGPFIAYQLTEEGPYAYGATWLVEDRSIAAESLRAPCGIGDRQIFEGDTNIPYIGTLPAAFDGTALTIGYGPNPMESILASEKLTGSLPESECAMLTDADVLGVIGRGGHMQRFWNQSLPALPESSEALTEEQQVQQAVRRLTESVEWLALGVTVDFNDEERLQPIGARYQTSVLFDHAAESELATLLADLSSEDRPATLAGLPAGDPLLIFTGAFAGEDNQTYYRQLAELAGRYWNRRLRLRDSLSARQFYGIFEEVGEHMQGVRLAAYRNPNTNGVGEYSVVFIADARDPEAFIQELQQMMRLARADEVDVGNPEGAVTDEEIAALVQNLGDRTFRVRRDATNRLLVIGTRARPYLEAGLAAESLELRTRARVILEHFETLGSVDAKHFFGSDLLEKLDPDFRYVVAGETLPDGTPVDWISITLPDESQPYAQQLIAWLGPDWNRWRVVRTGDHVVVCASSRSEVLGETLSNLQQPDQPSLQIAGWNEDGQTHQFELHFDAYEFVPERKWYPSTLQPGEEPGLTSFGLDITPDSLRIEAYSPLAQLRRLGFLYF